MFLVSISLQSFGRHCEKAAQKVARTSANGSKQKAGFGEGTPQQVRPVSETQFQLLKLWPQVDTCLSLFRPKRKYRFQTGFWFPKLGVRAPIEVSLACGRRLHRICVPAPVLQRCCPAHPHLCGVVARYPDSDGSCNFQGTDIKNCKPVVRLQILSEYKKTAPQGTKGFCRGQAAAKWFGVAAERRFITVKWFIWVRGYHEMGGVSREMLEF